MSQNVQLNSYAAVILEMLSKDFRFIKDPT